MGLLRTAMHLLLLVDKSVLCTLVGKAFSVNSATSTTGHISALIFTVLTSSLYKKPYKRKQKSYLQTSHKLLQGNKKKVYFLVIITDLSPEQKLTVEEVSSKYF